VLGRLGTSLCFLTVTIDIFISRSIQVESAKLNCSPIHLTISRHTDGLFLVKNTALVA
jgi:hypothetical protein